MMEFIRARSVNHDLTPHILFNDVPRVGIDPVETLIRNNPRYSKHCMTNSLKHFKAFTDPEDGKHFVWTSTKAWSGTALQNLSIVSREFYQRIFEDA